MTTVTLAEAAKLSQDSLIEGLVEEIITVNQMFQVLPFRGIQGNSLAYNRENVLGDVQRLGVGGTITAKNPATFTRVSTELTKIIGDAEVDKMLQATRSNMNDQTGIQIASKAKAAARDFQDQVVNGDGTANSFQGLLSLVAASQTIGAANGAVNGGPWTLADLDALIDQVTDKDGAVDFIAMPARSRRTYKALLRAAGGATIEETVNLPDGTQVLGYSGVPIFRNDWIPVNQTKGTGTGLGSIIAGNFDDGSGKIGISGITAANAAGLTVEPVGTSETKDEEIWRVKWYVAMVLYNSNGLAVMDGCTN